MFNPSRDQVRHFFCNAWHKHLNRSVVEGAEATAIDIILRHPEYQALLASGDEAVAKDWTPEGGEMNPFLHLSLHLAVAEQVSIDQPPGVRAAWQKLAARLDPHAAEHVILECLGETIFRAQQVGGGMDAAAYVESIERAARG
ncbi:MAG: hypothetical protein QG592_1167 [Pseudomonadota bacterium]|jgi:hypothetical protein|nr:hypothetical protein [Pseudomonadota bacterium]MDQ5960085.1 hypothetical protein [Pseudomonadota bacterium]